MLSNNQQMESNAVYQPHTPPRNTHNQGVCPPAPRANRNMTRIVPRNARVNRNLLRDFEMTASHNQVINLSLKKVLTFE